MTNAGKRLYIQPVTRQSLNPACRQSEGGRKTWLSSFSLLPLLCFSRSPSTSPQHTSETTTHPSPQLKVALHRWLCFLRRILTCKAAKADQTKAIRYAVLAVGYNTLDSEWLPLIPPSGKVSTATQQTTAKN